MQERKTRVEEGGKEVLRRENSPTANAKNASHANKASGARTGADNAVTGEENFGQLGKSGAFYQREKIGTTRGDTSANTTSDSALLLSTTTGTVSTTALSPMSIESSPLDGSRLLTELAARGTFQCHGLSDLLHTVFNRSFPNSFAGVW